MATTGDTLQLLQQSWRSGQLVRDLLRNELVSEGEADAASLALTDIAESVEKIYVQLVPRLLTFLAENNGVKAQDVYWDICEEFRHIDYHIHDAWPLYTNPGEASS